MSATIWLATAFVITSLLYIWVGKVIVSQPVSNRPLPYMEPRFFYIALLAPYVLFATISLVGFVMTDHGWWFLGAAALVCLAFAVRLNRS